MNENQLSNFKKQLETSLRALLIETIRTNKDLPEMMHGIMVMSSAGNFCKAMKKDYSRLKTEFENINEDIGLSEDEYEQIIDDITSKVLDEFIKS